MPHALHYTTLAEGLLGGVEVYNAAVINAGPREYRRLLETDVLPLAPKLVVVSLFVGNDLAQPPIAVHGGLLGVQPQAEFIFTLDGGVTQMHISQAMPTDMPPSADGLSLYLQVITEESSGGIVYGFSNVLQMTINLP